jgi:acyl carrier protein
MAAHLGQPIEQLADDADLSVDLNLDSFNRIFLHLALEQECGVEIEPDESITTVGGIIDSMLTVRPLTSRTRLRLVPKAPDA